MIHADVKQSPVITETTQTRGNMLCWNGPYRFLSSDPNRQVPDHVAGPKFDQFTGKNGVYLFTVNTTKGLGITYVGSTYKGKGFGQRLGQHLKDYLSPQYSLLDVNDLKQGIRNPLNVGWLNMLYSMQIKGNQNTHLPQTTKNLLNRVYRSNRQQRKKLIDQLMEHQVYGEICSEKPAWFNELRVMYEDGSSIDSFVRNKKQDAEKKKYFRAINQLLKEKYYGEYQQKNMKQRTVSTRCAK